MSPAAKPSAAFRSPAFPGATEWRPRAGAEPIERMDPGTVEECAEVLRHARAEGLRVLPVGDGSRLAALPDLPRADIALGTRGLQGVVDYESADGTLTARAGSSMAELAEIVAVGGHHLSPDVAHPQQGTLGGVIATGDGGRERLRYGALRHQVLGARVLLADGTSTKTGGKLVKNVTGYDLHKLYSGSWGSLVWIAEVSLRLYPLPEERAVVRATLTDDGTAHAAAETALGLPLRLETVLLERTLGAPWTLTVVCAGRTAVVAREVERLQHALPDTQSVGQRSVAKAVARVRDEERPSAAHLMLSALPGAGQELVDVVQRAATTFELGGSLRFHPGVANVSFAPDTVDAERLTAFHREVVAQLDTARTGATWTWRGIGSEFATTVRSTGPAPGPAPRALMERLRRALDPEGRFAGRVPGLEVQ